MGLFNWCKFLFIFVVIVIGVLFLKGCVGNFFDFNVVSIGINFFF